MCLGPPESTCKLTSVYSPHILKIFRKHINLIANSALNEMVCGKIKLLLNFKCLQIAQVFEATK